MYAGKIAACQATMMEGIGHCGSCPCLAAMTHPKFSMKSKNARKRTQMLSFVVWHLTMLNRFSAWPFSFRNLQQHRRSHKIYVCNC